MPYKYIMFDLDGTVIDSAEGIINSVKYTLEQMKLGMLSDETLYKFIGPPLKSAFAEFCGLDDNQATEAVKVYRSRYAEKGLLELTVYDGICECIKNLVYIRKSVALVTSKPIEFSETIAEHIGIAGALTLIEAPSLLQKGSSKTELINNALTKLNCTDKKEAVMIGDRKFDLQAATEAGIDSIGVTYGFGSLEELEGCNPTHLADNCSQLWEILSGPRLSTAKSSSEHSNVQIAP